MSHESKTPGATLGGLSTRRTWLLGVRDFGNGKPWRLKLYGITASGGDLSEGVEEAAIHFLEELLDGDDPGADLLLSPTSSERFGFAVLHEGTEAVWLVLHLWNDDIVTQHTYRASVAEPTFRAALHSGSAACVWELAVTVHERAAWIRSGLLGADRRSANACRRWERDVYEVSSQQPLT